MSRIEVKKNERGSWCVYIDGRFISDHATHSGARAAARNHQGLTTAPTAWGQ